ncbi:MAG: 4Fe-4S binding protein [Catonella sp.]|nr:4Fe-4S binding protein [Catonella sp.]MDY6356662.1 4Fe-4S binding protein [Catonella sp.]
MTSEEILNLVQNKIHSVIVATLDEEGLPVTCVIDMMLVDEGGLYFLTARGKEFYKRLMAKPVIALTGLKGETTMTSVSVNLRGEVRNIGKERLAEIFEKNPYMTEIYPTETSRDALEFFQIYKGSGEYFDLSAKPIFRQRFSFGGEEALEHGYFIDISKCIECGKCNAVCPQGCITDSGKRKILSEHCLHCGRCMEACPAGAVFTT